MDKVWEKDPEYAYRLGFEHALSLLMYDCGCTSEQFSQFRYRDKVFTWARCGGKKTKQGLQIPPSMTRDDAKQFVSFLNSAFWNDQGDVSDA